MARSSEASRRTFLSSTGALGAGLWASSFLRADDGPPLAPPDKQPPDLTLPESPQKTVGWAIVGLGKLALEEVMPAFAHCKLSRPTALVSGHPDKAKRVAEFYGIKQQNIYNYDNYDKLAENEDVDVIYIILPNNMHAEYTIRGHQAGKHVLCEKPMAVTVKESEQMIAAAKKAERKLMIAYRLRYEPYNKKVIELCKEQHFGKLRSISASNCQVVQAPNIRLSKQLGGGPLGDIGVYCLNACRYVTGEEPVEVTAFEHWDKSNPRFREVPQSVAFTLRFPSGILASCDCSFDAAESRRYRVHCEEGSIELDPAFSYRGLQLFTHTGGKRTEMLLGQVNHFAAEMEHFSECVLADKSPRTPGEEGLADMRIMAAIEESARGGNSVKLKRT